MADKPNLKRRLTNAVDTFALIFLGLIFALGILRLLLVYLGVGQTVILVGAIIVLAASIRSWPKHRWPVLGMIAPENLGFEKQRVVNLFISHLLFFDELHGLAIAFTHSPYESRVYRTRDGGVHWNVEGVLGSGKVWDVSLSPDGTIVLLQHFWEQKRGDWVALQISEDYGTTWDISDEIDHGWEAWDARFLDRDRGYIWGRTSSDIDDDEDQWQLRYTGDGGKHWEQIELPTTVELTNRCVHADGSVFYSHGRNLVRLLRIGNQQWEEEKFALPPAIDSARVRVAGNIVWLVGNKWNNGRYLYRWKAASEYDGFSPLPRWIEIDEIFSNGSTITIVGGISPQWDYSPASKMEILSSHDDGKTWQSEKARIPRTTPVAFFEDHMWVVGTGNRLLHRT
jgi:hypothetical protein